MSMPYLRFLIEETIEQLTDPPPMSMIGWKSVVGLAHEIEATRQKLGISKQILEFGEGADHGWYFARVWPPHADRGMALSLRYPILDAPDNWVFEENTRCLTIALQQWVRAVEADAVPRQQSLQPDRASKPPENGQKTEPLLDGKELQDDVYHRFVELTDVDDHSATEAYNIMADEYCYLSNGNRDSLITYLRQLKRRGKVRATKHPHT